VTRRCRNWSLPRLLFVPVDADALEAAAVCASVMERMARAACS
jgi:hypothetical protein